MGGNYGGGGDEEDEEDDAVSRKITEGGVQYRVLEDRNSEVFQMDYKYDRSFGLLLFVLFCYFFKEICIDQAF